MNCSFGGQRDRPQPSRIQVTEILHFTLVHDSKDISQKGSSLIEIMVVLTLISIVSGFSLIRLDRARNLQQRENVALQLKTQLDRARYDAVKRRATAASGFSSVTINQNSFSVQIDSNQNGVLDANESQNFTFDPAVGGQFVGKMNFPLTVSFDYHGRAKTVDSTKAEVNSVFTLCSENCVSGNNNLFLTQSNSSVISVSPTGTVAIKPGDVNTNWTPTGFVTTQSVSAQSISATQSVSAQSISSQTNSTSSSSSVIVNKLMTFQN